MKRRDILAHLMVGLIVITGLVQATYAAHMQTERELRAYRCCREHCPSDRRGVDPNRCCGIGTAEDGTAVLARANHSASPPAGDFVLQAVSTAALSAPTAGVYDRVLPAVGRASPVFLLNRHLLI